MRLEQQAKKRSLTYCSTYIAIVKMLSLLQVAITRQAISPRLATKSRLIWGPPLSETGNCATDNGDRFILELDTDVAAVPYAVSE